MSLFRPLSLGLVSLFFLGTTFASFSVNDFVTQIQTKQETLSVSQKKTYYSQMYNTLSLLAIRNRANAEQSKVFTSLKEYIKTQMNNLDSSTVSPNTSTASFSLVSSGLSIPNVDLDKIRDVWLSLHNTERQNKSLTPFVYSFALEGTASTWADHLADIGTTSHKRKSTDGYYSYESIKTWFGNQGIVFADESQQPLFTENLGWNMYSCKKSDCTDDFIKAIKKSRTFFMSEKGRSYRPHYNAIVGDFVSIGLGVALAGNKYYLVAHYSQALK